MPSSHGPKVQNRGWFRTCLIQTGAKATQVLIFAYRLRSAPWNAISSKRQKLTHGDFLTFRTSLQKRSQRLPRSHIYSKSAPLARRRGNVNAPPPPGDPGEIVIFDAGPRRNFFRPRAFPKRPPLKTFLIGSVIEFDGRFFGLPFFGQGDPRPAGPQQGINEKILPMTSPRGGALLLSQSMLG